MNKVFRRRLREELAKRTGFLRQRKEQKEPPCKALLSKEMRMKRGLLTGCFLVLGLALGLPQSADAKPWREHQENERFERLAERLKLNPEQRKKIDVLRYDLKRKMIRLKAEAELARLDLKQITNQHRPDLAKVTVAVEKLGKLELEIKKSRILMYVQMKSLLSVEQARELKQIWQKRSERWKKRRGGFRGRWQRHRWQRFQRDQGDQRDAMPAQPPPPQPPSKDSDKGDDKD
jgi:Spy/CpxP family protein refolding chaperone